MKNFINKRNTGLKKAIVFCLLLALVTSFVLASNFVSKANAALEYYPEYRCHIQTIGWTGWTMGDQQCGTTGQSLRMEAIQIRLVGVDPANIGVTYRAHVQNIGWQEWVSDGATAGTTGQGLRMEAIEIKLVLPGIAIGDTNNITYQVHVQNRGWVGSSGKYSPLKIDLTGNWFYDGATSGTTGEGLRLEAIRIDKIHLTEGGNPGPQ